MIAQKNTPQYNPPKGRGRKAEIALIMAKGVTDMDKGMGTRNLSRVILEAAERSKVKALVLRINSPGGSAIAAEHIARTLEEIKKDKPVVVTLGPTAASGGYWAALNANHITASPYSLTGSIGVTAGWFYNRGLNDKLGVKLDSIKRGEHADLTNGFLIPNRDLKPDEELLLKNMILELYDEFLEKAAKERKISKKEIEVLSQGRVYSGSTAFGLKLVDSLGSYLDAVETACKLAGIPDKKRIVIREYPKPKFIESLAARFMSSTINTALGRYTGILSMEFFSVQEELSYRLSQNGKPMPILTPDISSHLIAN
jgi:protease-4